MAAIKVFVDTLLRNVNFVAECCGWGCVGGDVGRCCCCVGFGGVIHDSAKLIRKIARFVVPRKFIVVLMMSRRMGIFKNFDVVGTYLFFDSGSTAGLILSFHCSQHRASVRSPGASR